MLAPYEVDRVAAPFADLTCGVQDYLAGRPGKVRSTITRTTKRFARDGVELVTVGSDGIDAALDDLARLHDSRWADGSVFLRGWERFCNAARAGATTGDVVVHALRDADGGAVAVELDLVLGDTVAFYQAGRRTEREWRGCGSVLRARIIEAAVAAGTTEYDLLRGDEPYKAEWATDRRELVRCTLGVGLRGAAAVRGRQLQQSIARRRADRDTADQAPDGGGVSP
jgi:CelD/BcsL family acetyltransferase involved in cellulose biosynthesis